MDARDRVNLPWLIRLRWGAALGHISAILAGRHLLGIDLPLGVLLSIIAVALATNLGLYVARRRRHEIPKWLTGGIMVADVLMLTGLLAFSGGPANPGVVFYFVHIGLATVVVGRPWRLAVTIVAMASLALLFVVDTPSLSQPLPKPAPTYLWGMLVSMSVAAGFILYFGDRVTSALARRETEIAEAREAAARDEKLASLATLSAGAAHELSTPLSTIAMLSRELQKNLMSGAISLEEAAEDARVIREEVSRCRDVLNLMSAEAGESRGEAFEEVDAGELLREAVRDLDDRRVSLTLGREAPSVNVPLRPTALALRGIVKNALQISPPDAPVEVQLAAGPSSLDIAVIDRGPGMSETIARRATEPFFTTKPAGEGMGLGLFLAHDLARRTGGELVIESEPERGTTVSMRLPRADDPRPSGAPPSTAEPAVAAEAGPR